MKTTTPLLRHFEFVMQPRLIKVIFVLMPVLFAWNFPLHSSEDAKTKKAETQQVGGLLFDVDEGVKLEKGPGGSVYMKSNKDYMQEKFQEIEARLKNLEDRFNRLETTLSQISKDSGGEKTGSEKASDGRKVLVT